jgi:NADH dehydrogenase (ubiquinone) Fe-S protein 1
MISIKINDFEFLVRPNISVLDACKYAGINVPRFCYHETLSISGNCRMCLVEIENLEKPLASCVAEVEEGMSIWVDTPFVKKARENVVEALLLNHPLDCPICDQAGECDLQDQTKTYGSSYSRFFFEKTSSEDKYCGPLIKTIMTRCITCTRCVRYAAEVAGVEFFGTMNRGNGTEIGAYVSRMFESEISGNVIDLCPVGALTSKPYAFKARPWELRLTESIDVTDSLGSNIYVNFKETEILRVLPKSNNDLNSSIISDKARFSYDANHNNRINDIFEYSSKKKSFQKSSWSKFFKNIDHIVETKKLTFLVDPRCDLATANFLKKIVNKYPEKVSLTLLSKTNSKGNLYIRNQTNVMNQIDNVEDLVILLGSNLRLESAVLNARVRFRYKNTLFNVQSMGLNFNENIPTSFVHLNLAKIVNVLEGKSPVLSKLLITSKKPFIIVGENIADRVSNVNNFIRRLSAIFSSAKFVFLQNYANSEGLDFLNVNSFLNKTSNSIVAVNLDDTYTNRKLLNDSKKSVWLNSHGSSLATKFKTIVPTLTSFETEQAYINIEARPQMTQKSFASFFDVKSTQDIVVSMFNLNKADLNSTTENSLSHIIEQISNVNLYDSQKEFVSPFKTIVNKISGNDYISNSVSISTYPVKQKIKDFYCTDTITRNSVIMQECSSEIIKNSTNFYNN